MTPVLAPDEALVSAPPEREPTAYSLPEPELIIAELPPVSRGALQIIQRTSERGQLFAQQQLQKIGQITGQAPEVIAARLQAAYAQAEFAMNFEPDAEVAPGLTLAQQLAAKPILGNIFETGKALSKSATNSQTERNASERSNFGKQVETIKRVDRPKYAYVMWNDQTPAEVGYGKATIVFNKSALARRSTLTPDDSETTDKRHAASAANPLNALAHSGSAMQAAGIEVENKHVKNELGYTEVQIWGELPISRETVKEIRVDKPNPHIEEMARRLGIPVRLKGANAVR